MFWVKISKLSLLLFMAIPKKKIWGFFSVLFVVHTDWQSMWISRVFLFLFLFHVNNCQGLLYCGGVMHFSCCVVSRNIAAQLTLVLSDNVLELYILPQILTTISDFLYCKIHVCCVERNTIFLLSSLKKWISDLMNILAIFSHTRMAENLRKIHFLLACQFCTTSK